MSPRRLVYIPAVALGLALLALPRTPAPVLADDLLVITADVSYDIRPDSGPVHVSWQVLVDNRDPQTAEQQSGTIFFYDSLSLPVLRGADNMTARAAGVSLPVSLETGDGPIVDADVSFHRRLFFGHTYSFSLDYDLPPVRDDSLLVTRYYVFLPAVSFGQESTVSITTPSDSAWEVNLEPGDCGAGPVFACRASSADEVTLAALAEVSRPDAAVTVTIPSPIGGVGITLTYFQGEKEWAQHLQELVTAALPVMEELYGFPYAGPPTVDISERGRQIILGYEGLTSCDAAACDIAVSPVADDVTALHELAHLWSDIYDKRWLAEGFANLIAIKTAAILGPGIARGGAGPPEGSTLDLRLDDWGAVTSLIAAAPEEEAIQQAGYVLSFRFLRLLEDTVGLEALQATNAALAGDTAPADSRRFMDALEEASAQNLDSLFLQRVFPDSFAPVLAQRREARDRLAALSAAVAADGLEANPLEAIREEIDAWLFEEALAALEEAEAGFKAYLGLKGELSSLREAVENAGLGFPRTIEAAIAGWRFAELERLIGDAEDALAAYTRARERVDERRGLWQRIGLLGRDPEGALDRAADGLERGDFEGSLRDSGRAFDMVDGAGRAALVRLLIVLGGVVALAAGAAAIIWFQRRRGFP